ncbi:MAG: type II toxin-antitoxin system PemK/MazF family toxin [Desertimonas sp.]
MTPSTGEVWLADLGAETRRAVYVVSDDRFHRFAERALVAPVVDSGSPERTPPWWVDHDGSVVAVERLTSIPVDRLLERQGAASLATVRAVQRTVAWLTGTER